MNKQSISNVNVQNCEYMCVRMPFIINLNKLIANFHYFRN